MAGWHAVRQTKFGRGLKFLKLTVDRIIRFFALFTQGTALFSVVKLVEKSIASYIYWTQHNCRLSG